MLHVTFTIGFTNVTLTMREARELVGYMAHAAHEMKFNPLDRFDRKASYERVRYTHIAHTDRYAFWRIPIAPTRPCWTSISAPSKPSS